MEILKLLGLSISIISLMLTIICIAAHYIIPKIRKNPGNFVLVQAYLQLYIDLNWTLLLASPNTYFSLLPCPILGGLLSLFAINSYFYCAAISLEVYHQMKNKIILSHHKRTKIYYLASIFITLFFLIFSIITESFGENFLNFCFFKTNSLGTLLFFIYYTFFLAFMWFTIVGSLRNNKNYKAKIISQYLTMVFATTVIETLQLIGMIYVIVIDPSPVFQEITLILAIILGAVLAIFRLWNKELIRDIKWKIFPKSMKFKLEKSERLLSWDFKYMQKESLCIAEFFEKSIFMVTSK